MARFRARGLRGWDVPAFLTPPRMSERRPGLARPPPLAPRLSKPPLFRFPPTFRRRALRGTNLKTGETPQSSVLEVVSTQGRAPSPFPTGVPTMPTQMGPRAKVRTASPAASESGPDDPGSRHHEWNWDRLSFR